MFQKRFHFFGSQCISIAVDVKETESGYSIFNNLNESIALDDFIQDMIQCKVGEFIVNSVDRDGMMSGFNTDLINYVLALTNIPVIAVGGGGNLLHYNELFSKTKIKAVGSASIFHFTQFTPLDIKNELKSIGVSVRL